MPNTILTTALLAVALAAAAVPVQAQRAAAQQAAPAVAGKPYRAVAITPPAEMKDGDFTVLRAKVAEAARNRDRAALAKLVAKGFFWDRDGADAAKGRSGMDVLAAALGLSNKDGVGWDMLAGLADDPSASPAQSRKNAVCGPAEPRYDTKAFAALLKDTQTDAATWGYPLMAGTDVRATPQASAPVIDKLGLAFVRVLPEGSVNPNYMRVLTPAGKVGFITIDALAPVGNDQLCYVKEGGVWMIGGYIGAGEP
ncbi:hypothetical protein [Undibacter mobilis]|uniref:SH3 domain-containing protein n=1 Tax=Undibacter mobilis TaxID=2292256 RepID=A0A371B749_9BRAD|nr:hypothetical protein [Undibacter mobilis]RDV03332.1 hypothetical protein DXH78_01245 [Undibacter mobilis]